jgi:hypothetical protein
MLYTLYYRVVNGYICKGLKSGYRGGHSALPAHAVHVPGETKVENVPHISVVLQWRTIVFKLTVFIKEHNFAAMYDTIQHR